MVRGKAKKRAQPDPLANARAAKPSTPGQVGAEYWRRATALQPADIHRPTMDPRSGALRTVPADKMPWAEAARGPLLFGDRVQATARRSAEERHRAVTAVPYRQLSDYVADPPLAVRAPTHMPGGDTR